MRAVAGYDGARAPVAQWTERGRPKACVGGSSPSGGATPAQSASSSGRRALATVLAFEPFPDPQRPARLPRRSYRHPFCPSEERADRAGRNDPEEDPRSALVVPDRRTQQRSSGASNSVGGGNAAMGFEYQTSSRLLNQPSLRNTNSSQNWSSSIGLRQRVSRTGEHSPVAAEARVTSITKPIEAQPQCALPVDSRGVRLPPERLDARIAKREHEAQS